VLRRETVEDWDCLTGSPVAALGDNSRFAWVARPARAERTAGLQALTDGRPHEAMKPVALL
jgi:hypothetical protein